MAQNLQAQYDELALRGTTLQKSGSLGSVGSSLGSVAGSPPGSPLSPGPGSCGEPDEHCNRVARGLFIGDITAAVEPERLAAAGITHVVDLANTIDEHQHLHGDGTGRNVSYVVPREEGDWRHTCPAVEAKLVVRVDDVDEAPLAEHFDTINDFTHAARSAGGAVLVHCFRGKSRSATAVIQYLMQREGATLKDALARTEAARPCIQLNVGFRKQLMALEAALRPGEPPSVVLKLASRKPVLSSMRGAKTKPKAAAATAATAATASEANESVGTSAGREGAGVPVVLDVAVVKEAP